MNDDYSIAFLDDNMFHSKHHKLLHWYVQCEFGLIHCDSIWQQGMQCPFRKWDKLFLTFTANNNPVSQMEMNSMVIRYSLNMDSQNVMQS